MKKTNSVLLLFILCCFCNFTSGKSTNQSVPYKDYHFIPGTNGLYKFHNTLAVWDSAVTICDIEGATFFYPEDESELNAVITFWENTDIDNFPEYFMVNMRKWESGMKTKSGIPISKVYNKWLDGEPSSDNGEEDCMEVWNKDNNGWGLNDYPCPNEQKYICKASISIKQDEQFSYTYSELLGKAYKFNRMPKNWTEAQAVCQEEHSDLAVIDSPEEAAHLVGLAKTAGHQVVGNFTHGVILLGFHKQNLEDWQTVQGLSLYDNEYRLWGKRQPDGGGNEECGAMFYNGHLADVGCHREALFICERVIYDFDIISEPDIS